MRTCKSVRGQFQRRSNRFFHAPYGKKSPDVSDGGVKASLPTQGVAFASFFFAYYAYVGIFSPYATLYFADRGMNAAQIGVMMSLIQALRIFGPNLWGWAADTTQRRVLVLRLTAWATALSFIGFFFGYSFASFFVVMVMINFFSSAQTPLSEALLVNSLRGDLTYYGRIRLWGSIGFIVAVTCAGQILDSVGVDAMPWLALGTLVLTGLASLRIPEEVLPVTQGDKPSVMRLLRRREVIAFFISTALMLAAHAAIYTFYSLYLEQHGYSKSLIGLMWSLGVLAEIVFFFYQAPLFRRFGVRNLMLTSLLLAVLRFATIGLFADSLLILLLAQVLHAATFGVHNSASVAVMQRWFSGALQARGQALFVSISYGLGGTLGSLGLSLVWKQIDSLAVFVIAAGLAVCAFVAARLSFRWQERDQVDSTMA